MVGPGTVGRVWRGRHGRARSGVAAFGPACRGMAGQGRCGMSDLRTHLESIYRQHETLSPRLVVDAARPADHPLHNRFQWDDNKAGERYRLIQAAQLIRSVRVIFKENTETGEVSKVRAFVSTARNDRPSAYLPVEESAMDSFTHQLVLRDFERQILALKRQFGHLKEYQQMLRDHGLDGDAA